MSEENKVEDNEAAEETKTKISVDKTKYQESRTASGSKSLSNGDKVAVALEGMTASEVYQVADNLIDGNDFRTKYEHLNVGMQRMNVGNRMRGFVNQRDKENEKITAFNADLKEGVEPKVALADAGELFEAAVKEIRGKVQERTAAAVEQKAQDAKAKEEAKAEKEAEKVAKAKAAADKKEAKEAETAEKAETESED